MVFTSFRGDFDDDDVLKLRILKTLLEGRVRFKRLQEEMQTWLKYITSLLITYCLRRIFSKLVFFNFLTHSRFVNSNWHKY